MISFFPRLDWSQVLAFAWWSTEASTEKSVVLATLRKDPKIAINELSKGEQGEYKDLLLKVEATTRNRIVNSALAIKALADGDPESNYRGYLPIPGRTEVGLLADLSPDKLADLLSKGIAGILEFSDPDDPKQAVLWAQELSAAWKDNNYLIKILQDPAKELIHKDELKNIFPLPDRPRGLKRLEIEELQNFLGDQDHMEHLGGIFLYGS